MTQTIAEIQKQFEDISSNDPKIKMADNTIFFSPYYWNNNLTTNFFLIIVPIITLTQQNDLKINIICILAILGGLILSFLDIKEFNNAVINLENKTVTIIPNIIFKILLKKKVIKIDFREIRRIDYKLNYNARNFSSRYKRYIIFFILANGSKIELISSDKKETALKITAMIASIVQ